MKKNTIKDERLDTHKNIIVIVRCRRRARRCGSALWSHPNTLEAMITLHRQQVSGLSCKRIPGVIKVMES